MGGSGRASSCGLWQVPFPFPSWTCFLLALHEAEVQRSGIAPHTLLVYFWLLVSLPHCQWHNKIKEIGADGQVSAGRYLKAAATSLRSMVLQKPSFFLEFVAKFIWQQYLSWNLCDMNTSYCTFTIGSRSCCGGVSKHITSLYLRSSGHKDFRWRIIDLCYYWVFPPNVLPQQPCDTGTVGFFFLIYRWAI